MKLLGVNLVFSQILLFEKSKTTVVELMIIVMKLHKYVKCVHFLGVNSVLWDREKLFLHWRQSIEHLREAFVVGLETLFSTNFQPISTYTKTISTDSIKLNGYKNEFNGLSRALSVPPLGQVYWRGGALGGAFFTSLRFLSKF